MATHTRQRMERPDMLSAEDLPPQIRARINSLVQDLRSDDLPLALLDLAHLYGALRMGDRHPADEPVELSEELRTLIFTDEGGLEDICTSPDDHGGCPRAGAD